MRTIARKTLGGELRKDTTVFYIKTNADLETLFKNNKNNLLFKLFINFF